MCLMFANQHHFAIPVNDDDDFRSISFKYLFFYYYDTQKHIFIQKNIQRKPAVDIAACAHRKKFIYFAFDTFDKKLTGDDEYLL